MVQGEFEQDIKRHRDEQGKLARIMCQRPSAWDAQQAKNTQTIAYIERAAVEVATLLRERNIMPTVVMKAGEKVVADSNPLGEIAAAQAITTPAIQKYWRLTTKDETYGRMAPTSLYTQMHEGPNEYYRREGKYKSGVALDIGGLLWHYETPHVPDRPTEEHPKPADPQVPVIRSKAGPADLLELTSRVEHVATDAGVELRSVSLPLVQLKLEELFSRYLVHGPQ